MNVIFLSGPIGAGKTAVAREVGDWIAEGLNQGRFRVAPPDGASPPSPERQ